MTTIFLQPVDVWMFRDGRPFDAGSAHRAESLFPPYPTVIQGAFRTHRLVINNVDLHDKARITGLVGTDSDFGALHLRGPFLARREKNQIVRFFPQPADAFVKKDMLIPASLAAPKSTIKTSQVLPDLFVQEQESSKQSTLLWLSQDALVDYLGGQTVKGVHAGELFVGEDRTGIGMGAARVVDEGMLYEAGFVRPREGVGLLVEMQGYPEPEWQQPGLMHLGGEKRMAYFSPESVAALPDAPEKAARFKLYFATPTYFENGWLPAGWDRFFAGPVELLGAAISHYDTLGGFNWVGDPNGSSAHRPARRFVPAGSVYYFNGNPQLKPDLLQQAITDFGAEIGFGQIIIKEW